MSYHDDYDDCDDYDYYDYYEDEIFENMARTIKLVMVIFHPLIKRQVDT